MNDLHGLEWAPEIAVDLDGTLAEYNGWKGIDVIGNPIPKMAERVKQWIKDGQKVVIFTSRVSATDPDAHLASRYIKDWLREHGFGDLEVTANKRKQFIQLWDDRAISVEKNTGNTNTSISDKKESALSIQIGGGHYKDLKIQPIEYCYYNKIPTIESTVIKYVTRHKFKGGAEDIRKAIHCLEMLLTMEYGE